MVNLPEKMRCPDAKARAKSKEKQTNTVQFCRLFRICKSLEKERGRKSKLNFFTVLLVEIGKERGSNF